MRAQTATRIGGWAFVLTGAGHLTLASLLPSTGDLLVVERQMTHARFPMAPSHTVADLMQGFSVTMSLLLVAWGVSVLLMTRHGRTPERAQLALMLALSLAVLVTAVLLLPAPPIVLMAVASFAFAIALIARRSAAASPAAGTAAINR
ncbi:LIC_13387 family protein [Cellulomonas sp. P5_C5]